MQRHKEKEPLVGAKTHTHIYPELQYEPIKKFWKTRVLGTTFPAVKDGGLKIMSST